MIRYLLVLAMLLLCSPAFAVVVPPWELAGYSRYDVSEDGNVDATDVNLVGFALAFPGLELFGDRIDFNDDGQRTLVDMDLMVKAAGGAKLGDVNLDGDLDSFDLVLLLQSPIYGTGIGGVYTSGDINCDGLVDSKDLDLLLAIMSL